MKVYEVEVAGCVVRVEADDDADLIQVAATARDALVTASVVVDGQTFTPDELDEWWA